jgi:hypothetical protein
MRRQTPVMAIIAASALALVSAATGYATTRMQATPFDPDAALRVFNERVESYAALHRRLAPPPTTASPKDPLAKLLTREYLASAIRNARRGADQGDIFTPDVATAFRWRLADSIGEMDGEMFLLQLNNGVPIARGLHPTVNETYTMSTLFRIPSDVRLGLPPLPAELDYRIAGHDLVLWDIYAGIVVDFVPNALTSRVFTE